MLSISQPTRCKIIRVSFFNLDSSGLNNIESCEFDSAFGSRLNLWKWCNRVQRLTVPTEDQKDVEYPSICKYIKLQPVIKCNTYILNVHLVHSSFISFKNENSKFSKVFNILIFRFPKDPSVRKQWIIATKRENFDPSPNAVLCGRHFSSDAFQIRQNASNPYLKAGAVPSVFEFPSHLSAPHPKKRRTITKHDVRTHLL